MVFLPIGDIMQTHFDFDMDEEDMDEEETKVELSPPPPKKAKKSAPPASLSLQQPQAQYNPPEQVYPSPLTPRTPSNEYSNMTHHRQVVNGNESGYETSTTNYSYNNQVRPTSSASPNSPSVYSDVSTTHSYVHPHLPPAYNTANVGQQQIPAAYYDNSEEDDILDAIVNWQDQN